MIAPGKITPLPASIAGRPRHHECTSIAVPLWEWYFQGIGTPQTVTHVPGPNFHRHLHSSHSSFDQPSQRIHARRCLADLPRSIFALRTKLLSVFREGRLDKIALRANSKPCINCAKSFKKPAPRLPHEGPIKSPTKGEADIHGGGTLFLGVLRCVDSVACGSHIHSTQDTQKIAWGTER